MLENPYVLLGILILFAIIIYFLIKRLIVIFIILFLVVGLYFGYLRYTGKETPQNIKNIKKLLIDRVEKGQDYIKQKGKVKLENGVRVLKNEMRDAIKDAED